MQQMAFPSFYFWGERHALISPRMRSLLSPNSSQLPTLPSADAYFNPALVGVV